MIHEKNKQCKHKKIDVTQVIFHVLLCVFNVFMLLAIIACKKLQQGKHIFFFFFKSHIASVLTTCPLEDLTTLHDQAIF